MPAIMGLGIIQIVQMISSFAVPYFLGNKDETPKKVTKKDKKTVKDDKETPEAAARRMKMYDTITEGIQTFAKKYIDQ